MIIDDVEVTADKNIFKFDELKYYVGVAKEKFPQGRLTVLKVYLSDDGKVACDYTQVTGKLKNREKSGENEIKNGVTATSLKFESGEIRRK